MLAEGGFFYHIAPSVIGALVSIGGGALLLQLFFVKRANEAAFIDSLVRSLEVIMEDAFRYWTRNPGEGEDSKMLEQKLKGGLGALSADLNVYRSRYHEKQRDEYDKLMTELMKCITGGPFETAKRKADFERYLTAVNRAADLRSALIRHKL